MRRAEITAEARSWLGTPWVHQHHRKGVGCDCVGLVVEVARAMGLAKSFVYPPYGPLPQNDELRKIVEQHLQPTTYKEMAVGDVALFAWHGRVNAEPTHLGFLGDYLKHGGIGETFSLIHADRASLKVTESILGPTLQMKLVAVYRFPGAE